MDLAAPSQTPTFGGRVRILIGDCRERLRETPEGSVHCVVTSPPYFALRDYRVTPSVWGGEAYCEHHWGEWKELHDRREETVAGKSRTTARYYGAASRRFNGDHQKHEAGAFCAKCGAWRGCLGLEASPDLYVEHLVMVFREVRRVLRDDGTVWLNLGDSYAGSWGNYGAREGRQRARSSKTYHRRGYEADGGWTGLPPTAKVPGCKPKDLIMVPSRAALALQEDGWWVRSRIIWSKGASFGPWSGNPMPESVRDRPSMAYEEVLLLAKSPRYFYDQLGASEPCRSGPSDFKKMREAKDRIGGKHKDLFDPLSKANVASRIGRKRGVGNHERRNLRNVWAISTQPFPGSHFATMAPRVAEACIRAGCPEGGTVLDPFAGAGTTGLVAVRLGRDAVLVELNAGYAEIAAERLRKNGVVVDVMAEEACRRGSLAAAAS